MRTYYTLKLVPVGQQPLYVKSYNSTLDVYVFTTEEAFAHQFSEESCFSRFTSYVEKVDLANFKHCVPQLRVHTIEVAGNALVIKK